MKIVGPKEYEDYDCRAMKQFAQKVSDANEKKFGIGSFDQLLGLSQNVTEGTVFLFLTAQEVGRLFFLCKKIKKRSTEGETDAKQRRMQIEGGSGVLFQSAKDQEPPGSCAKSSASP